jgi:peptidoglycan/LPS O-acetylase OafA/YrhL
MKDRRLPMLSDLNFRSNAIGFLRVFFAAVVVYCHAYPIGGFGYDPIDRWSKQSQSIGNLAVDGFFLLSGFLITRSYCSDGALGRFLWHRFLRIFPAFWVCLTVTALVFAPIAWLREHGTIAGFLSAANPSWRYVASNFFLRTGLTNIAGIFGSSPYRLEVNGSLWTLKYEFSCYLAVALFGVIGWLRKPAAVALLAWGIYVIESTIAWNIGQQVTWPVFYAFGFFVCFAFGSAAYLFRDRIPMIGWLAAACGCIATASIPMRLHAFVFIPCFSYAVLYAAMKLPVKSFDRKIDLSYGLYIYAFPLQQLLALFGAPAFGFPIYLASSFVAALAFALASWTLIERPSLSLKKVWFGRERSPVPA